ncbi:MAG: hypothetical protein K0Q48_1957 [Bacillota bacterium]|nr:hypothetical protein [Bacillota bacterium]
MLKGKTQLTTLPVAVDPQKMNGLVQLDAKNTETYFQKGSTSIIAVPQIPGVSSFTLALPARSISQSMGEGRLTIKTNYGNLIIPENMLSNDQDVGKKQVGITIGAGSKDGLSYEEKEAIGGRPLIQLALTLDGKQTAWSNIDAPVRASIPYQPTAEERRNPEKIVIWYLDGSGAKICIPNGFYDPASGMVSFTVTHFSQYAVGYHDKSFSDVDELAWYRDAVSFLAARAVVTGTGNGFFLPDTSLARGEFIVMLMRAYELEPDENPLYNFSDAGNGYYTGYLAAAKGMGITNGIGGNLFGPERKISRQEMVTLLYNVLDKMGRLPAADDGKSLSAFGDHEQIASWARTSMEMLVKAGVLNGKDEMLRPGTITTRAEMAQILYKLMARENL